MSTPMGRVVRFTLAHDAGEVFIPVSAVVGLRSEGLCTRVYTAGEDWLVTGNTPEAMKRFGLTEKTVRKPRAKAKADPGKDEKNCGSCHYLMNPTQGKCQACKSNYSNHKYKGTTP